MKHYKKAKAKYFRKRVEFWTLYYNKKEILTYGYGTFLPYRICTMNIFIMHLSDTDAFWYAHKLSVTNKKYSLKYGLYNRSVTFTTTKQ